ncbi:MAG TPA: Holliday junction resolvase RuvX [Rhodospirillaceae bacterium]|nr:Holliday junction resolvase RuvX [Rhodospirillaceae bacterium]
MAICNLSDLPALLKPNQCLLGLDPGKKTIGIAIADPQRSVASPLKGLAHTKLTAVLGALTDIVKDRNIGGIIMGLPKNMDGSEGSSAQAARSFAANLRKGEAPLPDLPIVFWDERLSTAAVERFMIEENTSRKRRSKTVDKAAAAYILQGALDALKNLDREKE